MNAYTVRRVVAACAVAGSMLMVPTESQAIFHWFGGCGSCGGGGATTAYRPYTAAYAPYYAAYAPAAPACNTCSPCAQTCNYMPQTCYRTVYQQVPVTAYHPVSSCDPCGNQVTAYRPVVSYQTQARLVPYTSYRPVYTPTTCCAPTVGCATGGCATGGCATGGCATGNCGTSVTYASPVSTGGSGCSNCNTPSYSTPTYSTPTYSSPSPAPSYQSAPATSGTPGSTVPSLAPTPAAPSNGSGSPRTFQDGGSSVTDPESRLRPIPDTSNEQDSEAKNKATNSTLTPRLLNPDDRTTFRPLRRNATVIPVAAEEHEQHIDDEGWRPARR